MLSIQAVIVDGPFNPSFFKFFLIEMAQLNRVIAVMVSVVPMLWVFQSFCHIITPHRNTFVGHSVSSCELNKLSQIPEVATG